MNTVGDRLKKIMSDKNITPYKLHKETGVSQPTIGRILKNKNKPNRTTLDSICRALGINIDWVLEGKGEIYVSNLQYNTINTEEASAKEESIAGYKPNISNAKPYTYKGQMQIKLVSTKAQAGYLDAYYSDEFLKDLPTVTINTDKNYKGNYLGFEVSGDSMEPEFKDGDLLICREVPRHLWRYKLHYKDWYFVIAHSKEGVLVKEIIDHDVDNGTITCHSLNDFYKDFKCDLREVSFLYNVVERRSILNKKK